MKSIQIAVVAPTHTRLKFALDVIAAVPGIEFRGFIVRDRMDCDKLAGLEFAAIVGMDYLPPDCRAHLLARVRQPVIVRTEVQGE